MKPMHMHRANVRRALDYETAETINNMVRYIADDNRIARHVGVPVEHVVLARSRLPTGDRNPLTRTFRQNASQTGKMGEQLHAGLDAWTRNNIKATQELAKALKRAR